MGWFALEEKEREMPFLPDAPIVPAFAHSAYQAAKKLPAVVEAAPVLAVFATLQGCAGAGGVPGAVGHGIPGFPGYSETVNPPDARIVGNLPNRKPTMDSVSADQHCRQAAAQPPVSVDSGTERAALQGSLTGALLNDGTETGNVVEAGANIDATTIRIQSFERNERAAQDKFRTLYIDCARQIGYAATAQFQGQPQFATAPRITVGVPVETQSTTVQNGDGSVTVTKKYGVKTIAPGVVTPGAPGGPPQ